MLSMNTAHFLCLSVCAAMLIATANAHCTQDKLIGCFNDHDRVLAPLPSGVWDKMTIATCGQLCFNAKLVYAGVEDAAQCFCGAKEPPNWAHTSMSDCNMTCTGASNETCGGRGFIAVFTYHCSGTPDPVPKPPPPPPPVYPVAQPCSQPPLKDTLTCNTSAPLDARVADLVSRIPVAQVSGLFSDKMSAVESLSLPFYNVWSEALHGVSHCPYQVNGAGRCCALDAKGNERCPTSFPAGITTGNSLNRTLFNLIGSAVGEEARSANNVGLAGLTFWTPNVNIFRDPRWGRGQETPGEDPTINSDYAEGFVSGFQQGETDRYLKASSCCKHYAGYSLENWNGVTRNYFDAIINPQDLADTYFPAFMSCANRGNASGLMCSYNAVNGVPSCASYDLLTTNLRDTWGFDGYITSDCGAVSNVELTHHYTNTSDATCAATLGAGMDSDCGGFFGVNLASAIADGAVPSASWERALRSIMRVLMRLGYFDPDAANPYRMYGLEHIDTPAHRQLALEAARQGIVLLKNDNHRLPLSRDTARTVAALGPNANATVTMQSNYFGQAPFLISVAMGLNEYANVTYAPGCSIAGNDSSGFASATAAAAAADVAVLVVGLDGTQEAEGHDRVSIDLPGVQAQLIEAVALAAAQPIVLVIMSGGPVDVSAAKANPKMGAILVVGYPGQSGGQATAETLFGDNNPSGKLTQTWYPGSYVDTVSMFDMGMRPNATTGSPGRTYRFYTGPTVFNFGDGMSYTTFAYGHPELRTLAPLHRTNLEAELQRTAARPHLAPVVVTITVLVTNTGMRQGTEVVMLYVVPPAEARALGAPQRTLRRYERVALARGVSQSVTLGLTAHDLAFHDPDGILCTTVGTWLAVVGDGLPAAATVLAA